MLHFSKRGIKYVHKKHILCNCNVRLFRYPHKHKYNKKHISTHWYLKSSTWSKPFLLLFVLGKCIVLITFFYCFTLPLWKILRCEKNTLRRLMRKITKHVMLSCLEENVHTLYLLRLFFSFVHKSECSTEGDSQCIIFVYCCRKIHWSQNETNKLMPSWKTSFHALRERDINDLACCQEI